MASPQHVLKGRPSASVAFAVLRSNRPRTRSRTQCSRDADAPPSIEPQPPRPTTAYQDGYSHASDAAGTGVSSSSSGAAHPYDAATPRSGLAAGAARRMLAWAARAEGALRRTMAGVDTRLLMEATQLMASLLFILLYIWSTYQPEPPGSPRQLLDLALSCVFAADYVHRLAKSRRPPLLAALEPLNIIDLLSFGPSLLSAAWPGALPLLLEAYPDLRWFRVFRALRLLRLSLLVGNLPHMRLSKGALLAGAVNVPLLCLLASVVAWVFTTASMVHVMEKMPWHDACYFVMTTLTTVGYGDVVIKSSVGRMLVLVLLAVAVVLIPQRAATLYAQLASRKLLAGALPSRRRPFVLWSGRLSEVRGFNDFLEDFLGEARAGQAAQRDLHLVAVANKPSYDFQALQELNERHLTLMEGSAFTESDLLRARAAEATAAMVLADRFSGNAAQEDTDVQFRVWALKSFTKHVPLYVQVLRKASMARIQPFLNPGTDVIFSIEQIRMRLLALSAMVPGASTLVANLLRGTGSERPRQADASMAGRRWLREYADGCHADMGFGPAPSALHGLPFHAAADALYAATGALIIGLVEPSGRLVLNPGSVHIQPDQQLAWLAGSKPQGACVAHASLEASVRSAPERVAALEALLASGQAARQSPRRRARALRVQPSAAAGGSGGGKAASALPGRVCWDLDSGSFDQVEPLASDPPDPAPTSASAHATARASSSSADVPYATAPSGVAQPEAAAARAPPCHFGSALHSGDEYCDPLASGGSWDGGEAASSSMGWEDEEIDETCLAAWAGALESDSMDEHDITALCGTGVVRVRATPRGAPPPSLHTAPVGRGGGVHPPFAARTAVAAHGAVWGGAAAEATFEPQGGRMTAGSPRSSGSSMDASFTGGGGTHLRPGSHASGASAADAASGGTHVAAGSSTNTRHDVHNAAAVHAGSSNPTPPGNPAGLDQLRGHVIIAGSEGSFLPFVRQLHLSFPRGCPDTGGDSCDGTPLGEVAAAAAAAAVPARHRQLAVVVLHPHEPPGDLLVRLRQLGPTHFVRGWPSDSAALEAAGAQRARSLVYLGPMERPSHTAAAASVAAAAAAAAAVESDTDYGSTSRAAVLSDAEALLTCYGVGEEYLPDMVHTVVELSFTSSVRFLQPGLLLQQQGAPFRPHASPVRAALRSQHRPQRSSSAAAAAVLPPVPEVAAHNGGKAGVGGGSAHERQLLTMSGNGGAERSGALQQPRTSFRHRKQVELQGRAEGLTEWQLNAYYAAGRVLVPALLDTFTTQAFFKGRRLTDLLTELAGDDGRAGGAMLQQAPVPPALVGCTYSDLVALCLLGASTDNAAAAQAAFLPGCIPVGLLRKKAENRAWRLAYVAIHPRPSAVLEATDSVFLIRLSSSWEDDP